MKEVNVIECSLIKSLDANNIVYLKLRSGIY